VGDRLQLAINRATEAHKGQVDKAGVDYIQHPLGVLKIVQEMGGDESAQIVAVLHDCIEDTGYGLEAIAQDFGWSIALSVLALSRISTPEFKEDYNDYLVKVKLDPTAKLVKIADVKHNNLESRLALLPKEKADRFRKHGESALKILLN
jgi:(p)ppGpp synthase/HD superfamily hydrolase